MSEVVGWPLSTKGVRQISSCRTVLYAILGITTIVFILCLDFRFLQRPGDGSHHDVITRGYITESAGGLASTPLDTQMGDEAQNELLGWRIQNQTRRHQGGRTRLEPGYIGWHPRKIDYAELTAVEAIQPGRLELVRHADFGATPVLFKVADAHEATMYRLLYNLGGITPAFLGHVTQNGECVGIITEFVQRHDNGALSRPPPAGQSSWRRRKRREACLAALRRMHGRGIAHRDAHGENCLLRQDGSAALIDFELSAETESRAEFDRDLWVMYHTLSE